MEPTLLVRRDGQRFAVESTKAPIRSLEPNLRFEWLPREEILTYEELIRLARVAARCGIRKIRVTGGEPLLRRDLPDFIRGLKPVAGIEEVALTTNGSFLARHAGPLAEAGLDRINVSLDTLDPERFRRLARRDGLDEVLRGMDAAETAGFGPLKVNCVAMRGVNDDEILPLLEWGRTTGREVRFIEFMPLEGDNIWERSTVVPASEILDTAAARYAFEEEPGQDPRDPARTYRYLDGAGRFGIIASVTRAFCSHCDRIRIAPDVDQLHRW